jgi:uncharacterized membrane protein YgdD (TMEM256/DUF423 family)
MMREIMGPTDPWAAYHTPSRAAAEASMDRAFAVLGALSALAAVALGAFAAHGLKGRLSDDMFAVFEVGARYQMYHALALFATAWAATRWSGGAVSAAGWLFVAGTVVFSGSLYALALGGPRWLGALTPFGGIAFLAGWLALGWAAWSTG